MYILKNIHLYIKITTVIESNRCKELQVLVYRKTKRCSNSAGQAASWNLLQPFVFIEMNVTNLLIRTRYFQVAYFSPI